MKITGTHIQTHRLGRLSYKNLYEALTRSFELKQLRFDPSLYIQKDAKAILTLLVQLDD